MGSVHPGERFGRLVVIEEREPGPKSRMVAVRCDCGGERWSDIAHEVWRMAPGEVEHVLDVDYEWGEDGIRTIVTREPTSGVEDDCDDEGEAT
jgi:hypothetical protein